jgi:ABC-type transport system involved in multi-copper enzyme maturation permease subunit
LHAGVLHIIKSIDKETKMFLTIVRREFFEHVMNFRLFAIFVLTVILMTVSVVVFSANYQKTMKERRPWVTSYVNDDGKTDLYMAPCTFGEIERTPTVLSFCSGLAEKELPNKAGIELNRLSSISKNPKIGELISDSKLLDWAFIVSVILSFAAGLLTYKSISGERRDGTLVLVLSNPLPRSVLLLAKYSAAMLALTLALLSAIIFSLITLQVIGSVSLAGDDFLKIAFFTGISLLFLSVFVFLGLICSVFTQSPLISAVTFLFNWILLVFVIPNMGGIVAGMIGRIDTPLQVSQKADAIDSKYPMLPGMTFSDEARVRLERKGAQEQLMMEYIQSLVNQVNVGRDITRISPASTFSYAAESITGNGTIRFSNYLNNVKRYRENIFQAILQADKKDTASQHIYMPNSCGGENFSKETVDLGNVKVFYDPPPTSRESFDATIKDIAALVLFNMIVVTLAFWIFTRMDVAPAPGV